MISKIPNRQSSSRCIKPAASNVQQHNPILLLGISLLFALACTQVQAHGVSGSDGDFLANNAGVAFGAYFYLGAKHMVTGYDHLLFLTGVVFFLHRLREVMLYVSLFAIGHSTTLLLGVLADWQLNIHLVDTIIGLSVVYKGLDNLGAFARLGWQPDMRLAVLLFGLWHGLGLATKLQELRLHSNGLVSNILAFNLGVEAGQLIALGLIVTILAILRPRPTFDGYAIFANWLLLVAGFVLAGFQLTGYLLGNT